MNPNVLKPGMCFSTSTAEWVVVSEEDHEAGAKCKCVFSVGRVWKIGDTQYFRWPQDLGHHSENTNTVDKYNTEEDAVTQYFMQVWNIVPTESELNGLIKIFNTSKHNEKHP